MEQNTIQEEALETVRRGLIAGKTIAFPSGVEVRDDELVIHPALNAKGVYTRYGAVIPQQVVEEREKLHRQGRLPCDCHDCQSRRSQPRQLWQSL